jgi:hypothetical protein
MSGCHCCCHETAASRRPRRRWLRLPLRDFEAQKREPGSRARSGDIAEVAVTGTPPLDSLPCSRAGSAAAASERLCSLPVTDPSHSKDYQRRDRQDRPLERDAREREHALLIRQRSLAGHSSAEGSQQRQEQTNPVAAHSSQPSGRAPRTRTTTNSSQPASACVAAGTQRSVRISRIRVRTICGSYISRSRSPARL